MVQLLEEWLIIKDILFLLLDPMIEVLLYPMEWSTSEFIILFDKCKLVLELFNVVTNLLSPYWT